MPPRRRGGGGGGRRGGTRREGDSGARREGGSENREPRGRDGRPKKTQEELDAEMADYFNPGGTHEEAPAETTAATNGQLGDDVDMIE